MRVSATSGPERRVLAEGHRPGIHALRTGQHGPRCAPAAGEHGGIQDRLRVRTLLVGLVHFLFGLLARRLGRFCLLLRRGRGLLGGLFLRLGLLPSGLACITPFSTAPAMATVIGSNPMSQILSDAHVDGGIAMRLQHRRQRRPGPGVPDDLPRSAPLCLGLGCQDQPTGRDPVAVGWRDKQGIICSHDHRRIVRMGNNRDHGVPDHFIPNECRNREGIAGIPQPAVGFDIWVKGKSNPVSAQLDWIRGRFLSINSAGLTPGRGPWWRTIPPPFGLTAHLPRPGQGIVVGQLLALRLAWNARPAPAHRKGEREYQGIRPVSGGMPRPF